MTKDRKALLHICQKLVYKKKTELTYSEKGIIKILEELGYLDFNQMYESYVWTDKSFQEFQTL